MLDGHSVLEGRKLIRSGPGKSADQDFHFDYDEKLVRRARNRTPLMSLIVPIEPNARLRVRGKPDIVLQVGDFILFASRFEHAGAGYDDTHFRLFSYIGPQGFNVGNVTDYGKGWIVDDT